MADPLFPPLTRCFTRNSPPIVVSGIASSTPTAANVLSQPEAFQVIVEQSLLITGFAVLVAAVIVSLFVSRRIPDR